jgi:peptide chain release factor 1
MIDKLEAIDMRFIELEDSLASGQLTGSELTEVAKERARIEPLVMKFRVYKQVQAEMEDSRAMAADSDSEIASLARQELASLKKQSELLHEELILLSLPTDPNDHKNILIEIRAGTGGEESAIFAADLFRMYTRYAESQGWKVEPMSSTHSQNDGYKEVIAMIRGEGVFSRLKFESGVHRVQRVPVTESQGRIHTSACTVAVLPEAEDIDIEINPSDLDIGTFRASGAGGQHVNTTDSAVRVVHKPSGLVVECQDERSQHKNKDRALKVLKTRLYEKAQREQADSISADRKSQVGSGDRSERIRTYNFPQGRLTDHRINLTLYKLGDIIQGDLTEVLNALGANHQAELLQKQEA